MVESSAANLGDLINFEHIYPVGTVLYKDGGNLIINILSYDEIDGIKKVCVMVSSGAIKHSNSYTTHVDVQYLLDCDR